MRYSTFCFSYYILESGVFYTYSACQGGPATFQVLGNHLRPVAARSGSAVSGFDGASLTMSSASGICQRQDSGSSFADCFIVSSNSN